MQLKTITVRKFKNFVEAQEVEIESDVTALVGKNESGKTTVLKALHRLNPANGTGVKFSLTKEYPRWRLSRDRRADESLSKTLPIEATFALEAEDIESLSGIFEAAVPEGAIVHASRNYDNGAHIWFFYEAADVIQRAASDVEITGEDLETLLKAEDLDAARAIAKERAKVLKESGEPLRAKAMTAFAAASNKFHSSTVVGNRSKSMPSGTGCRSSFTSPITMCFRVKLTSITSRLR